MTQETIDNPQQQQNSPGKLEKLWTSSFAILWQSQLVSTLGDAVYSIALGFWVLTKTGSTALMGTLMAVSTLPYVLISPFAGVVVDRYSRKILLIVMDFIRAVSILLVAVAAFSGLIEVWMVFVAGILLSVCGAFFSPGINSAVPDMVPKSKLTGANSALQGVTTGSNMLGSAVGGYLYQAVGAPLLFLFNGLSFLFSSISILFVKVPKVQNKSEQHFLADMRDGFLFMWRLKGMRYILLTSAVTNFFSNVALVLFMPLFERTPSLGAGKYGLAMACFTGGMMFGFIAGSVFKTPCEKKLKLLAVSLVVTFCVMVVAVNQPFYWLMLVLLVVSGTGTAIVNVMIISSIQAATPSENRGKVMAFVNMTCTGLTPFAMALGGVLGGFIPLKVVISCSFSVILFVVAPVLFSKSFKRFINYDFEKGTVEGLLRDEA